MKLSMAKLMERSNSLLKDFEEASDDKKWSIPFPMAVFGTLRRCSGNTPLMGSALGAEQSERWGRRIAHNYDGWSKAFLPHFHASGLTIYHKKNDSGVFEVFFYDAKNWKSMIPSVDSLEGFRPGMARTGGYGYHRTLMWLHLLPADLSHKNFDDGLRGRTRTWEIPPEKWADYPRIPAWAYSNMRNNKESLVTGGSPVIWTGTEDESAKKSSVDKQTIAS